MEWISSWAGQIIIAVIIATLLEMILPEGKNKKYIKMVIGIYVVFTIISPVISKADQKELSLDLEKYENYFQKESYVAEQKAEEIRQKNIDTMYQENLKMDIQERLKQIGFLAKQIQLELETKDNSNYGRITQISLQVEKEEQKNKIKVVNQIQIGKDTKQEQAKEKLSQKEKQKVIETLNQTYQIEENQIHIID